MKRLAVALLKLVLSVALVAWLFARAARDDAFGDLARQYRDPGFQWAALVGAFVCIFVAVLLTLWRWYLLVRALGIPLSIREALRLGFLGYLFNLAPMGIVGGDLLKAVLLARRCPGRRAQAVATVAVDRVLGLWVLFVVAAVAAVVFGFLQHPNATVRTVAWCTVAATLAGTAVMAVMFVPGATKGRFTGWLGRLPLVGRQTQHLLDAVRLYRHNWPLLAVATLQSVCVHVLFTVGMYWLTLGIYPASSQQMTLSGQFVVALLSAATGVIPLMMGPMEAVLNLLYRLVFDFDEGRGFVVALAYRLVTLAIALVGVCYYVGARQELAEAMHEPPRDDDAA